MPDDRARDNDDRPKIDVTEALGEAGHEVEQLGYEGVADTGPLIKKPEESQLDEETELDRVVDGYPPD